MASIAPLDELDPRRFDTPVILKRLASTSRKLALNQILTGEHG